MFYSKYRPQRFEDLVGLDPVRQALVTSLKKRRVGHAYLFYGPRGTGKTTVARLLAKALNCVDVDNKSWDGNPCGKCDPCRAIESGRFLDLIEIDAASNRGIDDIRNLRDKIGLAPSHGRKKVYIIDEVHMLTLPAFNALLKTLEEPPTHAVFILATTELDKVPATIRSRCQEFEFKRAKDAEIKEKLQRICSEEGVTLSGTDLAEIARVARGGYRDAENLLEQVVVGEATVNQLLGAGRSNDLADFVDFLIAGNVEQALTFLNHFFQEGGSLERFNNQLLGYLRDLLLIKLGVGDELVEAGSEDYQKMHNQVTALSPGQIRDMINEFTQSVRNLPLAPIATLPMELAVVNTSLMVSCRDGQHCDPSEGASGGEEPAEVADLASPVEMAKVNEGWGSILKAVRSFNHSLEALLRSVRPKSVQGEFLILEASYPFHQERVSEVKNLRMIEKAMASVLGFPVKVKCVLGERPKATGAPTSGEGSGVRKVEEGAAEVFGSL